RRWHLCTTPSTNHRRSSVLEYPAKRRHLVHPALSRQTSPPQCVRRPRRGSIPPWGHVCRARAHTDKRPCNKYPPAKPEVLRLLAPQRGLTAIAKSKPKTEQTRNGRLPELSNFGSPPAEPGVYHD